MPKQRLGGLALLVTVVIAVWIVSALGAPAALLVDHGGTVLSTPQVSAIYLGDYWLAGQGASDALHTDAFLQTWLAGPSVTGVLAQYRVGVGSFTSSDNVAGAAPVQFTDTDAQALVKQELAAGRVVGGAQTVHVVYLPPSTLLTFQGVSSLSKLGAYHSNYRDSTGKLVYYAVVVYNQGTNGIDFNGNPQDNITIMTSRALAGALTDPDVGQGTLGWRDDVQGEVGDIAFALSKNAAFGDVFAFQNGFAVVLLWSNKDEKLDAGTTPAAGSTPAGATPAGATPAATATGSSVLSVSPTSQTAAPGATAAYTVSSAATATETFTLTVSGLPADVTGLFAAPSIAPGGSTTLTLTLAAAAATGATNFTVTGSGATSTESSSATLTISTTPAAAPTAVAASDFSMTVTPTSQETTRGGDVVTFQISTKQAGPGSSAVRLKTMHLRRGINAYLSRSRIAAGETATLTLIVRRDAKRGTHEFLLKGTSRQGDQRVTLTVVVK